jgi:hypothetical protein
MRDYGNTLNTIYLSLLSGITYGGVTVPVYSSEPFETTPDNYIVLTDDTGSQKNNDQAFISEVVQTIEVVSVQNMSNDTTPCVDISDQILQALLPNSYVERADSLFRVQIINATLSPAPRETDGTVTVNRRIIRVFNRIIQK